MLRLWIVSLRRCHTLATIAPRAMPPDAATCYNIFDAMPHTRAVLILMLFDACCAAYTLPFSLLFSLCRLLIRLFFICCRYADCRQLILLRHGMAFSYAAITRFSLLICAAAAAIRCLPLYDALMLSCCHVIFACQRHAMLFAFHLFAVTLFIILRHAAMPLLTTCRYYSYDTTYHARCHAAALSIAFDCFYYCCCHAFAAAARSFTTTPCMPSYA